MKIHFYSLSKKRARKKAGKEEKEKSYRVTKKVFLEQYFTKINLFLSIL